MRMMVSPITAERLAVEMEVSQRSIYRDIDSLRAAGARIEGERGYGYRLIEDKALPPQTFDRIEIEAIALGLAEVKSMGDPELANAAASVLAKVSASLPEGRDQHMFHAISQVYRPDARYKPDIEIDIFRQACWREEALAICYVDKAKVETDRTVYPLAIVYTDRMLTALCWCCLRKAFRMFRFDGIFRVQVAGESFRPRRAALLRDYLAELRGRETSKSPA